MTDTNTLILADFEPCLGQTFVVTPHNSEGIEMELIQVKPLGKDADPVGRQPFSLLFRGPLEPVHGQQMFRIENATLGEFSLFLVPIGPDDDGMLYDATFN